MDPFRCYLLHLLFPHYPTQVAIVWEEKRARVLRAFDYLRLLEIVRLYDGYAHVFTRLYPVSRVNKIVFDIDAPSLDDALKDLLSLVAVLDEEQLPYVAVFSGRKGFHVYLISREVEFRDDDTMRMVLKSVIEYYADMAQLRYLDVATGTKPGGWIRVPGTIHPESGRRSCYLPMVDNISLSDVLMCSSNPSCPELPVDRKPIDPREYVGVAPSHATYSKPMPTLPVDLHVSREGLRYVLDVLRPCIAYHSLHDNPSHFIRTQLAAEMCWLWFSEKEICDFIEQLRWDDYDRRVTCYHVRKICEKVRSGLLMPASCDTIRERGYCLGDRCPYHPRYWPWWMFL